MHFYGLRLTFLAAFLIALSGCATDRTVALAPGITQTDLTELPEPDVALSLGLEPMEKLNIRVVGIDEMTGAYDIDAAGQLRFPYVGQISTDGLSSQQLAQVIETRLRDQYVLDPHVVIQRKNENIRTISVGGQVNRSGTFPVANSQTLMRAINNAGGLSKYAQIDDVLVLRNVEGQKYIGVYNLGAIQRGNYKDPSIFANDVIIVGDSPSRRTVEKLLQFIPLVSTAAVFIDRFSN